MSLIERLLRAINQTSKGQAVHRAVVYSRNDAQLKAEIKRIEEKYG